MTEAEEAAGLRGVGLRGGTGQGKVSLSGGGEGTGVRAKPPFKVRAPQACESPNCPGPGCLGEALLRDGDHRDADTVLKLVGEGRAERAGLSTAVSERAVRRWRVRAWPGVQKPLGSHLSPWWEAESADP